MSSALKVHYSSKKEDWQTPDDLYTRLNDEFGPFTLDAAASSENAKCAAFFSKELDALNRDWTGRVWLNPPYGRKLYTWFHKAVLETKVLRHAQRVVMLVPARTDTRWFHDFVQPYADDVQFLKGRVTFKGAKHPAPFPSMVVVFERSAS